jgi:anti-sigma regulatory factor (Ser/Thr protein kinase)
LTKVRKKGEAVRNFIVANVGAHPKDIATFSAAHFKVSRQAVHRHLKNLVVEGALLADGGTRATYTLAPLSEWTETFPIGPGVSESEVWRIVAPQLGPLPENVREIWHYGFSEMFNNVIDHSESSAAVVNVTKTAAGAKVTITDFGVGIFRKIQVAMGLGDERHAVLELAKGKFTTDPARHSGEGIFFTSRSFDKFRILSGDVYFSHDFGEAEDWILGEDAPAPEAAGGTRVTMEMSNHTSRTLRAIFDEFSTEGAYGFTKTVVPVKLARYGDDNLVSRSQARRLMTRFERFKTVMLDFGDIDSIGQAFADEVFRVFPTEHPNVRIVPVRMASAVEAMRAHVLGRHPEQGLAPDNAAEPTPEEHASTHSPKG